MTEPKREEELDITIWITADGRVYVHNINGEAIELARGIDPHNRHIQARWNLLHKNGKEED